MGLNGLAGTGEGFENGLEELAGGMAGTVGDDNAGGGATGVGVTGL